MNGVGDPKTNRELLLKATFEIQQLREAVNNVITTFSRFEQNTVVAMEKRLLSLESSRMTVRGMWKAIVIISGAMAALIGLAIKAMK